MSSTTLASPRFSFPAVIHSDTRVAAGSAAERRFAARVFLLCLAANVSFALLLMYGWRVGQLDGISRTANAFYVLFSRDPHLAAIGFVWPALPSLVQLALLPPLFAIGHPEFAGPLLSSVAGAGAIAVLGLILGQFGVTGWIRMVWLGLIAFHPQIFYQSANGVAEMPFLVLILLACYAYFSLDHSEMGLATVGLWLALAFLVRYEALAFMAAFAFLLLIRRFQSGRGEVQEGRVTVRSLGRRSLIVRWLPGSENWRITEGRLLIVLIPAGYAIGIWIILNWMILGDPLYFMRSTYSLASAPDVAKNVGIEHPLFGAMGSPVQSALYAIYRILSVQVGLFLIAPITAWIIAKRRDRHVLEVVTLMVAIFGFTTYQVYAGSLPTYFRYWMYATPLAVILLAAIMRTIPRTASFRRLAFGLFGIAMLAAGAVYSINGLSDYRSGQDEQRLASYLLGNSAGEVHIRPSDTFWVRYTDAPALGKALDQASADGLTMIDIETGFFGVMKSHFPQRLAVVSDRDFMSLLDSPGGRVRYIFAAQRVFGAGRDLITMKYPGLYEEQVTWARYRGQVEGTTYTWKIFEVDYSDPSLPAGLRLSDDGSVSPRFAELRAATPTLPELMIAWQTQRYINGKDPHDWEAFVSHVKSIARLTITGSAPREFENEG